MSAIKLYIPRVLGNVAISQMRRVFAEKDIGKLEYIKLHRRKNEHNHTYSFAFLTIKLFDTNVATEFAKAIEECGFYNLFYDRKNYWEVKKPIPRQERDVRNNNGENDKIAELCETLRFSPTADFDGNSKIASVWYDEPVCIICKHSASDLRHAKAIVCDGWCIYDVPNQPQETSKFITLFERIQAEEDLELKQIKQLCQDLTKYPSVFSAQDSEDMEREFDELVTEVASLCL